MVPVTQKRIHDCLTDAQKKRLQQAYALLPRDSSGRVCRWEQNALMRFYNLKRGEFYRIVNGGNHERGFVPTSG